MATSSEAHVTAIVIYTYASVYTHTLMYMIKYKASKPILREIRYFCGIKKTVMMITLPQWKPS